MKKLRLLFLAFIPVLMLACNEGGTTNRNRDNNTEDRNRNNTEMDRGESGRDTVMMRRDSV